MHLLKQLKKLIYFYMYFIYIIELLIITNPPFDPIPNMTIPVINTP